MGEFNRNSHVLLRIRGTSTRVAVLNESLKFLIRRFGYFRFEGLDSGVKIHAWLLENIHGKYYYVARDLGFDIEVNRLELTVDNPDSQDYSEDEIRNKKDGLRS